MPDLHGGKYETPYNNLAEPLAGYDRGGYCPVHIGERFKAGRYEVQAKLGFGDSSTVWLARDHEQSRWVALKVKMADARPHTEHTVLEHLRRRAGSQSLESSVVRFFDTFLFSGTNGMHRCLVLELLGPDVVTAARALCSDDRFPAARAAAISKQLLHALQFVHAGDVWHLNIKRNKILLHLPHLQSLDKETIVQHYGIPQRRNVSRIDGDSHHLGVPYYLVDVAVLDPLQYQNFANVKLVGFNQSHHSLNSSMLRRPKVNQAIDINVRFTDLIIPPPESHKKLFGAHTDIWLAGYVDDALNMFGTWPDRLKEYRPSGETTSLGEEFVADYLAPKTGRTMHESKHRLLVDVGGVLAKMMLAEPGDRVTAAEALRELRDVFGRR
ncbi:hypothetical protein CAC42_301 [Sphaceloma murrayae]|uniref:non-specific serine/threonine protein kinase n=1 Tax=Sphaceloma murrayae TaxID=2082308 RepID=A0A2K1QZU7_9PEZI|nr:hypothetical protein CAC42_301 [Sphaceloma murrayae]